MQQLLPSQPAKQQTHPCDVKQSFSYNMTKVHWYFHSAEVKQASVHGDVSCCCVCSLVVCHQHGLKWEKRSVSMYILPLLSLPSPSFIPLSSLSIHSHPFIPLPSFYLLFHSLFSLPNPFPKGSPTPLIQLGSLMECCKLPPAGPGARPPTGF